MARATGAFLTSTTDNRARALRQAFTTALLP
jgi:hypothetical protein